MELSLKEKIIACYGHLHLSSVARTLNCDVAYVRRIWESSGFNTNKSNRYDKYGRRIWEYYKVRK